MKVGFYISELLFEHETVILPGLGEFFTQYVPAKFVPEKQRVESPYKVIAFDPEKKEGDTPLIGHMAARENMDTDEVKTFLQDFVAEIRQTLTSGKQLKLVRVGVFSQGEKGDIVFEPDRSVNYLEDTAGMDSSIAAPEEVSREEDPSVAIIPPISPEEPEKDPGTMSPLPATEEPAQLPSTMEEEIAEAGPPPSPGRDTTPRALKWIAYTVVPLLVIIIILALNFDYFFGRKKAAKPVAPAQTEEEFTAPPSEALQEQAQTPAEEPLQAFDPTAAPPAPEAGREVYHIIVGSFPDQTKAEEVALSLRSEEAPLAGVFMNTRQGFYRVSYGYYYDLQEAKDLLAKVQAEVNAEAWILHR
jgi:hypothetical protein